MANFFTGTDGATVANDINQKRRWCQPQNGGTPKWMVKMMENPIKMDDLGVPLFSETPKSQDQFYFKCCSLFQRSTVIKKIGSGDGWFWLISWPFPQAIIPCKKNFLGPSKPPATIATLTVPTGILLEGSIPSYDL